MDLPGLLQAVNGTGFEAEWVEMEVTGAVSPVKSSGSEPSARLHIEITGQDILLIPGDTDETRRNYAEVMRRVEDGKTWVRIRGRAPSDPGENLEMSISRFEVLEKHHPGRQEPGMALRSEGSSKSDPSSEDRPTVAEPPTGQREHRVVLHVTGMLKSKSGAT